ncbi:MAG: hypothetical protein ABL999_05430 [Pyrinomonadaceae bacterium]
MTIRWTLIGVTIIALLSQPFALLAQQADDWAAVKTLGSGQEIRVETKSGKKFDGTLGSVSDNKIVVVTKGKTEEVAFTEVKKVHRVGNGSRGPGIAIGAAAGAGVGAAIGGGVLAATGGSDDTIGVITPFILVGAGLGALAGAFIPRKKRTLIYEAK